MDYNKARAIVEEFELNVDVVNVKYNNVSIWPILKNYLRWGLLRYTEEEKSSVNTNKKNVTKSIWHKIQFHFSQIYNLVSCYLKFHYTLLKYKIKVKNYNVLCIDVSDKLYEDIVDGKRYSRYFSPYVDFLKKQDSVLFLNSINSGSEIKNKNLEPYYYNKSLYFTYNKIRKSYLKKIGGKKNVIENFDYVHNYFKNAPYSSVISKDFLTNDLEEISIYESFWMNFLKAKKPKLIYLSCHYGNRSHYGMLSAAKQLNIKTVEIQHGIALSEIYLGYYNTPIGGYNYLPDYYWCWSKFDAENILRSRNKSTEFLPVVGGNLWLGKSINENLLNEYDFELEKIVKERSPKKIIFVTLQHSIPVSESLIDAIRSSDEDCFWLIRFHPRDYVDPEYRKKYVAAFSNLKNVEYVNATKASLYNILKFVNVHITHHSNVAVEAISFNVPTILLGDKFKDIYKDYIDAGVFFIANNSIEIERLLDTIIELDSELMERFKMQYEESVALNAFNEISIS